MRKRTKKMRTLPARWNLIYKPDWQDVVVTVWRSVDWVQKLKRLCGTYAGVHMRLLYTDANMKPLFKLEFNWKRCGLFCFFRWVVFVLALQSETLSFSMGVVKWMLWLSLFRQFPFFRVILISRLYRLKANVVFPAVHSWPVLVHSKFYTCLTPMDSFSDPDFYCSVRWSNIENNVDHKLVYYRRKSQIF